MAERRNGNRMAEWRNGRNGNRMAEMVEWWNGGMGEWREWRYGGKNGRMAEWQNGYIRTIYGRHTPTTTTTTTTPTTTLESFIVLTYVFFAKVSHPLLLIWFFLARVAQLVETPGLCMLFYQRRISKFQS